MTTITDSWNTAKKLIDDARHIVVLQAENPDGDSLGSALALEALLSEYGKEVSLYCRVIMPAHLHYMPGWDRVNDTLPKTFDLTIVVDSSVQNLFSKTFSPENVAAFQKGGMIIFDHHSSFSAEDHLDRLFTKAVTINEPAFVATGELLYKWAEATDMPLPQDACEHMTASILSDSLGLMSEGTSANTVLTVSELMKRGVSLSTLEQRRREVMHKSPEILAYKGLLLQRVEYHLEQQLALVRIPWKEIAQFSDQYNPSILVLDEMRLVDKVRLTVAIKTYPDGKLTAKLRANPNGKVAAEVAMHFGGGGHPYAAGFKVYTDDPETVIHEMVGVIGEKLREYDATRTTTEPC